MTRGQYLQVLVLLGGAQHLRDEDLALGGAPKLEALLDDVGRKLVLAHLHDLPCQLADDLPALAGRAALEHVLRSKEGKSKTSTEMSYGYMYCIHSLRLQYERPWSVRCKTHATGRDCCRVVTERTRTTWLVYWFLCTISPFSPCGNDVKYADASQSPCEVCGCTAEQM